MAMHRPPFPIPSNIKNGSHYVWYERTIHDVSDGDQNKWPRPGSYRPSAQEFYLCYLGQKWAEKDGLHEDGVHYFIDKLPTGYAMFEIDQPSGAQVYKRLFGHPSGKFYDSAIKFEPHFLWLMSGMESDCTCTLCFKGSRLQKPRLQRDREGLSRKLNERPKSKVREDDGSNSGWSSTKEGGLAQGRTQRRLRQSGNSYAKDEEGNEDIYKDCVKKLELAQESKIGIEIDLTEENSIDWKADRECLPQYLTQIEQQHVFVPRIGELVLWCPKWPEDHFLFLDPVTSKYRFYSFKDNKFHGYPKWRGGVVATVPTDVAKNGSIDFPDILDVPNKSTVLTKAGFRVETIPDPNDDIEKSLSKQYKYVPLRNIRPLSQWQILLNGTPRRKIHPSILNAFTCMTSISLLEKWRFLGTWPHGSILCKGIYLGSELITVGDTVRLLASKDSLQEKGHSCVDVLVVTSIRYNLIDMKPEHAQPLNSGLSTTSSISFVGQAFTTEAKRAHEYPFNGPGDFDRLSKPAPVPRDDIKVLFNCVGGNEYGPWYCLHGPTQKFEISHEQVLGKLYEADAVRQWLGQRQSTMMDTISKPALDFDVKGIISARHFATETDERLAEPQNANQINWYLADTRAQALGISSLNGLELGHYCTNRDIATLERWRHQVKIADGREIGQELISDTPMVSWATLRTNRRGRPAGSKIIDGRLVLPGQLTLREGIPAEPREEVKLSSQMAEAALASDSDSEGYQSQSSIHDEVEEDPRTRTSSNYPLNAKRVLTKLEIIANIDRLDDSESEPVINGDSEEDDEEEEEDYWQHYSAVLRGGTEESAGGDYEEE